MKRRTFGQVMFTAAGGIGAAAPDGETANAGVPGQEQGVEVGEINEAVSIADIRLMAKARMLPATFDYIDTGSCDQTTLVENVLAFRRIQVLPPLLSGVGVTDMSTDVLGRKVQIPILLAPVAGQRMFHPEGGIAAARAADRMGTIYGMSSSVHNSVEEIAEASKGPKWFQLYVPKDRKVTARLVERVEEAGFKAIVLTVDLGEWKDSDRRNRFSVPKDFLVKHLRDIGFNQINMDMPEQDVQKFNAEAWDLALSWEIVGWLRKRTKLPIILKGVLREEDAHRAVIEGVDGIVVSNHGGRRLDGMPSSIASLKSIVEVADGHAEVYLDSGIRRGTDVLKALALGAKAVLVGRPYAWGLGAAGEAGVYRVLELLRDELQNAMISCGCAKVDDISAELLRLSE